MNNDAPTLLEDFRWLSPTNGWEHLWLWLVLAVLVLAGLGWLWWKIRRNKQRGAPFFAPPPHVNALKALEELRALLESGDDLEFVKQVSGIVRTYIQERFGLRAPHRSTEEFLWEAECSSLLAEEHRVLLGEFLAQCDLIKFALHRTDAVQKQNFFTGAKQFIEASIPAVEGRQS
jgi:hypothetical protein